MFWIILIVGIVLFFVLRGKKDRPEQLGASRRALPTGPLEPHTFPCPYPKCPTCAASGDKMKQDWDGLRAVKWTCGYCGALAGVQTLKDEELPPSAKRRLGLDGPMQGSMPMQPGGYGQPGGGMGGLLTGMMIGSMMGGGHHHDRPQGGEGWGGGSSESPSEGSSSSDWGESGSSDWGDSGGGGDWGGGDSGGDSGGDW